jgi:hypothetical protein
MLNVGTSKIVVESGFPFADAAPPPDTLVWLLSGVPAVSETFTVTVIVG